MLFIRYKIIDIGKECAWYDQRELFIGYFIEVEQVPLQPYRYCHGMVLNGPKAGPHSFGSIKLELNNKMRWDLT